MSRILKQWIEDSMAADMKVAYDSQLSTLMEFEFADRYADFYVNLITQFADLIDKMDEDNAEWQVSMMEIACGLNVFLDRLPQKDFVGVDQNTTLLYIATIYYLCSYPAVAAVYIRLCDKDLLNTEAAAKIRAIVSGCDDCQEAGIIQILKENNRAIFEQIDKETKQKNKDFIYSSVYDFFESTLLEKVMEKFARNNLREDLYSYDSQTDWNAYINYAVSRHIYSFLPSQQEAFKCGLLSFEKSFSLHMPTSAGKSFITELLIYQELRKRQDAKVLYLAPLRSLSHELKQKYSKISQALGFSFRCIYGGCNFSVSETFVDEADMLISTPEAFMGLEGAIDDILLRFTLVICDEGQLLVSDGRGLEYELLLSRMIKQNSIRFLFISAIVPNVGEINTWLGGHNNEVCSSDYRPTDLRFGFYMQVNSGVDVNVRIPRYNTEITLSPFVPNVNYNSVKDIACSIAMKALSAGSVMLYTSFKRGNASCEKYGMAIKKIVDGQSQPSPLSYLSDKQREHLMKHQEYTEYLFGSNYYQTTFIKYGYAVHHGSVPQCMREIIESAFADGIIKMVICNKTLSEGVNFPVKTLVLGDIRNPKDGKGLMPLDDLVNVIGRAGRAGKETYGMVIGNADKLWYIMKAAKGEGLQAAKGQLKELLDVISEAEQTKHGILTNGELNTLLDTKGYAKSIDKMIILSTDTFSFQNTNIDTIASSSLTYHLTSESGKRNIRRVFNSRYQALQKLPSDKFEAYKATGVELSKLTELSSLVHDNLGWNNISISDLCRNEFVGTILQLTSFGKNQDDRERYAKILMSWMRGEQYIEIANQIDLQIDEVVEQIEHLTYDFLMQSKAIIRYVCYRFNIENEALDYWPLFVEKGLNSMTQAILYRTGLSDRIALHVIDGFIQKMNWDTIDKGRILRRYLRENSDTLYRYLKIQKIPTLSIERVNEFLKTNSEKQ